MTDQRLPQADLERIVVDAVTFAGSAPERTTHGVTARVAASGPLTVKIRGAGGCRFPRRGMLWQEAVVGPAISSNTGW